MNSNRCLFLIAILVLSGALACPAQTSRPYSLSDEPTTATAAPEPDTNTASPFAAHDPDKLYWNARLGVWGMSLAGTVGVRGFSTGVDASFDDLIDNTNIAAMPSFQLTKGNWLMAINGLYAQLEDSGHVIGPLGIRRGADVTSTMGVVDVGVGYTLLREKTTLGFPMTVAPVIGGRWTYLDLEVNPEVIDTRSGNRAWFDPYVGATATIGVTRLLDWQIAGNVGGFGVGSDFTWAFQTMLEWHFARHASLDLGYRVLAWDYDLDNFKWDVTLQGPWIGISINN
jgi:hypothetical protein